MARAWAAITRSSPRARASWTSRAAARAAPSRSPATGSSRRLTSLPDHVAKNRAYWERTSDAYQERHGRQLAEKAGLAWGVWQVPEAELNVLGDGDGLDVLELGCGRPVVDFAGRPRSSPGMRNDYFELERFEDAETVDFQLPYGEWIRLLRANGFELEDLIELRPPQNATTTYDFVALDWARRWPAENIWKARKRRAADK